MKLIALALSDLHLHIWKTYNEDMRRTKAHFDIFDLLCTEALESNVPILFPGDLIHKGESISMELLDLLTTHLDYYLDPDNPFGNPPRILAIPGNHDQDSSNRKNHKAKDIIRILNRVYPSIVTDLSVESYISPYFDVYGVPYFRMNDGLVESIQEIKGSLNPNKLNFLLIHTVFPGSKDTNGFPVKEEGEGLENIEELFDGFDLVLCGHVHKYHNFGGNIYNVGAPNQQRITDMGSKMGYLEIYLDNKDIIVKRKIISSPEFRYYKGENPPDGYHYYIKEPEETKTAPGKPEDNTDSPLKSVGSMVKAYHKDIGYTNKIRQRKLIRFIESSQYD